MNQTKQKQKEKVLLCPVCGTNAISAWKELEYEKGGDDPMYGGDLITVNFYECDNPECVNFKT